MSEAGSVEPIWLRVEPRRRATAWPENQPGVARRGAAAVPAGGASEALAPFGELHTGVLFRLVLGVDTEPTPMPAEQVAGLGDPFATALLKQGKFPLTLTDVLAQLDTAKVAPSQQVYIIGEAGQIPPTAPLQRDFRFAVVRGPDLNTADLLVSSDAVGAPEDAFLQLAAWDDAAGIFNYYMRIGGTWVWAGDSNLALSPGSRGQGCFDSHVNGSVVMKELKRPWIHWQSMKATLQLAADDPLRTNPLYVSARGAEQLELIIRPTVRRWTTARLQRGTEGPRLNHLPWILRQLCTSTTVNLASSDQESAVLVAPGAPDLVFPMGLWFNVDLLLDPELGIEPDIDPPTAPAALYADSLTKYAFAVEEGSFRQAGDTFFAFLVPEAAFEDTIVALEAIRAGILSAKFVAAVAMVDFSNPVYSPARAHLMKYVPDSVSTAGGLDVSDTIASAIIAASKGSAAESPEALFATNWALSPTAWQPTFVTQIENYVASVIARAKTAQGFDDYTRLADSRRREFRQARLFEFSLTLPTTNILQNAPLLEMNADGTISQK